MASVYTNVTGVGKLLQTTSAVVGGALGVLDGDSRLLDCNAEMAALYGGTKSVPYKKVLWEGSVGGEDLVLVESAHPMDKTRCCHCANQCFYVAVRPAMDGHKVAVVTPHDCVNVSSVDILASSSAIFQTSAEVLVESDHNGLMTAVSAGAGALFGHPRSEMIGKNVSMLLAPPVNKFHNKFIQRFRATGSGKVVGSEGIRGKAMTQGGVVFEVLVVLVEIYAGDSSRYMAAIRPLDPALRQSLFPSQQDADRLVHAYLTSQGQCPDKDKMVNAYDVVTEPMRGAEHGGSGEGEAVVIMDTDQKVIYVSEGITAMLGYRVDEVVGQSATMLMAPPYDTEHEQYMYRYFSTGEARALGGVVEGHALAKDKTKLAVKIAVAECEVGDDVYFYGWMRNANAVAGAKEEEAQMTSALGVLQALVESSGLAVVVSDESTGTIESITGDVTALGDVDAFVGGPLSLFLRHQDGTWMVGPEGSPWQCEVFGFVTDELAPSRRVSMVYVEVEETEIRANIQNFRTVTELVLDAMTDGVAVTGHDGYIMMCNAAFCGMFELRDNEEAEGRKVGEFMAPSSAQQYEDRMEDFRRSRSDDLVCSVHEYLSLHPPGGESFPMSLSVSEGCWSLSAGTTPVLIHYLRDVTNDHAQASRVRAEETRLHTVLNVIADAIVVTDELCNIELINAPAEVMFRCSPEDVEGKSFNMFLDPAFACEHYRLVKQYLKTGIKTALGTTKDVQAIALDGTTLDLELSLAEAFVLDKRIYIGLFRNLEDGRRREAEYRHSVHLCRDFVGKYGAPCVLVNLKGIIVHVNPNGEKVLQCSEDSIVGESVSVLVPYPHSDDHPQNFDSFVATKELDLKRRTILQQRGGHVIPIFLSICMRHEWKGEKVATCTITDMSTTQRREEEMRRLENQVSEIIRLSSSAIVGVDGNGQIISFNPAAIKMFGYSSEEIVGQMVETLVPQEFRKSHREHFEAYVKSGSEHSVLIGRRVTAFSKDGREILAELTVTESAESRGVKQYTAMLRGIEILIERERNIKEETLLLQASLDNLPDAMISIDKDGIIQAVNREAEMLLEQGRKLLYGKNIDIFMCEDIAAFHTQYLHEFITKGRHSKVKKWTQVEVKTRKRGMVSMDIYVETYRSGPRLFFVGLLRDTSAQHQVENIALEEADLPDHWPSQSFSMPTPLREPTNGITNEQFGQLFRRLSKIQQESFQEQSLGDDWSDDLNSSNEVIELPEDRYIALLHSALDEDARRRHSNIEDLVRKGSDNPKAGISIAIKKVVQDHGFLLGSLYIWDPFERRLVHRAYHHTQPILQNTLVPILKDLNVTMDNSTLGSCFVEKKPQFSADIAAIRAEDYVMRSLIDVGVKSAIWIPIPGYDSQYVIQNNNGPNGSPRDIDAVMDRPLDRELVAVLELFSDREEFCNVSHIAELLVKGSKIGRMIKV